MYNWLKILPDLADFGLSSYLERYSSPAALPLSGLASLAAARQGSVSDRSLFDCAKLWYEHSNCALLFFSYLRQAGA